MSGPASRRAFLRDLTKLPLIGGSVVLLGTPTAVAEPVTPLLLDSYEAWLGLELRYLLWERYRVTQRAIVPGLNAGFSYHGSPDAAFAPQPSTRAALVLGAVACDWRDSR